jgi:membrane-associated phospholipid phosphatase
VIFGSTGVILAVTPFVKSERFKGFSFTLAQAMILNNVLTITMKAAVSRTRPNEKDSRSFPSGHASNAFAWSTVAARCYGWKIGVPAYSVATFIALSRVEKGAHYLSDVIAGSTVGFISGITAVRGSKHSATEKKWTLLPSFGRDHTALCFKMSF